MIVFFVKVVEELQDGPDLCGSAAALFCINPIDVGFKLVIGAVGASMKSVDVDVQTDFVIGFLKFANWTSNG
jgi:hypothetical protein